MTISSKLNSSDEILETAVSPIPLKRISSATYDICIVGGLGRVGLPLGLAFAGEGMKVVLHDIDNDKIQKVSGGEMPFFEEGAQEILSKVIHRSLYITNDSSVVAESQYIVVVIGTPVDEYLNPKHGLMKKFFEKLIPHLRNGQTIILRSTVYPGTSRKVYSLLKRHGLDVHVTFCPERVLQGKSIDELKSLPQIISGFSEEGIGEVRQLFSYVAPDTLVLKPEEAELTKIFNNAWRYIQFATANQFYMIASQQNIDFYKICDAMKYKYSRAKDFPSAGFAAGPCLLKDTMQLSAFANNHFFLGHSAMLVNEGLPNFLVEQMRLKYNLPDKTVGILGMAFKADNDDKRDSLAYKLKKILENEAGRVLCSDPYLIEDGFFEADYLIRESDIVVLGTPHGVYKVLDIKGKVVIDIWNFFGKGGLI